MPQNRLDYQLLFTMKPSLKDLTKKNLAEIKPKTEIRASYIHVSCLLQYVNQNLNVTWLPKGLWKHWSLKIEKNTTGYYILSINYQDTEFFWTLM